MVVEFPVQNDEYNYHDSLQAHLKAGEKGIMGPLHDPTTWYGFKRVIARMDTPKYGETLRDT